MPFESVPTGHLVLAVYLLTFGTAAVACFVSVGRVRHVDDPDTRRGLVALLVTSGGWALAHAGFLVVPTPQFKVALYQIGLVIGLATVGPWLYFCSAYTGRALHRIPTIRRIAVGVFLVVVLVKLTNPLHELYFTTEPVAAPFPHLAIHNQPFHWLVMGLSYALAMVGYFMLFELFVQVGQDTTPLAVLTLITGLPLVLDLVGSASPLLLDVTYEPLGVAAFAVGVSFVYERQFRTVRLAGGHAEPTIVLSDSDRIRGYNESAAELFPDLARETAIGEPVTVVLPEVVDALAAKSSILDVDREGTTRYYQVSENPFGAGGADLGRLVVLTDITDRERYRRELERQNDRLEEFASIVSHDLRNPLTVAMGRIELAKEETDASHLEGAIRALDRMDALIDDVLTLARQGQPIDDTESVTLSSIVRQSWEFVETADATLVIERDFDFVADPDRLQQLLENLFRNAVEHGGSDVTIRVGPLDGNGFYVADDGPGIPEAERSKVFESGYSTAENGTGFGLSIAREIAEAHGWEIGVAESRSGGTRFEISNITPCDDRDESVSGGADTRSQ